MRVKVCGATQVADVELLAAAGADFVGLWHGVPRGHAELSGSALARLADAARTTGPRPILVTLSSDLDTLGEALARSGIRWVQLHGYQQPAMVRRLKAAHPAVTVVKVLHMRGGECVERALIPSYERAGVDVFLLDALAADGRIGSTALTIEPAAAAAIADRVSRPVMLAGGLTADNSARYRSLTGHPRFYGIDVDSGSRDADGRIDARQVALIRDKWTVVEHA
ncbi:phosphoribosylanthranilate isomerase [Actinocrispum wychmicini]|uniref:N-(5'-phosphoribosyl)anthranilate isomerase n=1 Tax=Actinocrispum wychmicini TaxID=1213861 RepID=A0A4R2JNN0_9PSEU|nr:N-(5'-phosphoribosyl)anthranilate isomerase [Actinocrispum wychmicini]TCO60577.1 phosphoribosylanthranilate isomerase [Actinocrispum wychmicini]